MEVCKPTGSRCCQNFYEETGNTSTWIRVPEFGTEIRDLRAAKLDERMSRFEHEDAYSKIAELIAKARAGKVDAFARRPESKDIQKPGFQHLVELIPKVGASVFGKERRLVRLYFVEPLTLSDKLVGLHVATKPDGGDPHGEQDAAIREAGARGDHWYKSFMQLSA